MSIYEIVQRGKAMQKIESDRQFAMANGMDPQNIVDLKSGKSRLNAKNYLKVAKAAGMDLDEALEFLEKVEKQKGFARVPAMLVAAVFAAVTLIVTPYPAEAAPQLKHNSSAVYIMLNYEDAMCTSVQAANDDRYQVCSG